jgi:hypothetical protein
MGQKKLRRLAPVHLLDRVPDPHPNMADPDPKDEMPNGNGIQKFRFKVLDGLLGMFGGSRDKSKCI